MVFSSITFLLFFLPPVFLLYFVLPRPARNYVLLAFSLLFYAWGEPIYVLLMLLSIGLNYVFALWVDSAKRRGKEKEGKFSLGLAVAANLLLLGFFKYADFLVGTAGTLLGQTFPSLGIVLPIGISFYTFQAMSYVIDVYRGEARVQKNPFLLGTYVSLFPQLIAGPIVRYVTVADELEKRQETWTEFGEGASRFITGLAKKVLLANTIGQIFSQISVVPVEETSVVLTWIAIIAYTLQIYYDFSGYSDMAIGLGKMFGFHFLENFNYPYIAKSITGFWRRWHISLSTWFRDYVYIPLGGNRKGLLKQLRNILIVWALTGIWHGAGWNFVLWGLYYAVLLMVEKLFLGKILEKCPAILRHVYTLVLVMVGWTIFAMEDVGQIGQWLTTMFGVGGAPFLNDRALFYLSNYGVALGVGILCCLPWKQLLAVSWIEKSRKVWEPIGVVLLLVLSFAFLVSSSYNPFLYFRF